MKHAWYLVLLGAFLVSWTGMSYGVFETPTSTESCRIEPYALAEGIEALENLQSVGENHGYDIADLVENVGGVTPRVRLEDFVFHLNNGDGIFGICSHGNEYGLAVKSTSIRMRAR
jgi:hypothetical protein